MGIDITKGTLNQYLNISEITLHIVKWETQKKVVKDLAKRFNDLNFMMISDNVF